MKFALSAALLSGSAAAVAHAAGIRDIVEERRLQASAKFAAVWSDELETAAACINADDPAMLEFWGSSPIDLDFCEGLGDSATTEATLALMQAAHMGRIKIPQNKEAMIHLSSQIDILTLNTATSVKVGGRDTNGDGDQDFYGNIGATSAAAGVVVKLHAVPVGGTVMDANECYPRGGVTMSSRYVELRNQIGGEVTYEDCFDDPDDGVDELVCQIKLANTTLASTIGLAMDTAAAHSFQWLCVDLEADSYNMIAEFTLSAEVADLCDDTSFGDCSEIVDLAAARVVLNKRIMTVQEVRATNKAFADLS